MPAISPADLIMLQELFNLDGSESAADLVTAVDDLIMTFETDKRVMSGSPRFTAQERRDTRQCLKAFIGLKARLVNPAD